MSEIVVDSIVRVDAVRRYLNVLKSVGDEAKIHINDEGFHTRIIDPANVAMVEADLSADAFESHECGTVTVGVNLNSLSEALGPADGDDLVNLRVDMATRNLEIEFGNVAQSRSLIDADSIREEPDLPDLDLPNEFVMPGAALSRAVDVADMVSDHITIGCTPDADALVSISAEGDIDSAEVTFTADDLDQADVADGTEAMLSLQYVKPAVGVMPDAGVRVVAGHEFPVTFEWAAMDEDLTVTQLIAPRIKTD